MKCNMASAYDIDSHLFSGFNELKPWLSWPKTCQVFCITTNIIYHEHKKKDSNGDEYEIIYSQNLVTNFDSKIQIV